MTLRDGLENLDDRRGLLKSFDTARRDADKSGLMTGLDAFEAQAFDLILGNARDAFDVTQEDPRLRDRYGTGLGERMLLARRLCEAGVGFVTVHFGGWDMHGSIEQGIKQQGPAVDQAVAAFVDDLADRGPRQGHPAGHHRRVRPHAEAEHGGGPRPLGPALHAGAWPAAD